MCRGGARGETWAGGASGWPFDESAGRPGCGSVTRVLQTCAGATHLWPACGLVASVKHRLSGLDRRTPHGQYLNVSCVD